MERNDQNLRQAMPWFVIGAAALVAAVLPSLIEMSAEMQRLYTVAPTIISILMLAYLAQETIKFPLSEQHIRAEMSREK
jgi:uncharacterized membrane protein YadS